MTPPPHHRARALDSLPHGFFGRQGGVSSGLYSSLNCGLGSNDARDAVLENRARVAAGIDGGARPLLSLYQVHSSTAVTVEAPWPPARGRRPTPW
uniref:laccase domain-containing protein n=1 Tax=Oleomonas cavernae TaxID=2320859 RepID=UPI0026A67DF5